MPWKLVSLMQYVKLRKNCEVYFELFYFEIYDEVAEMVYFECNDVG